MKYGFEIREIFKKHITVEADSFEDAKGELDNIYNEGIDFDRNSFEAADFTVCCSKCGSIYEFKDFDWYLRKVDEGTPFEQIICDRCVADLEDNGTLTRCENCENLFNHLRLETNPVTGEQEICPFCKKSLVRIRKDDRNDR